MLRKQPSSYLLIAIVGGIVLADTANVPGWIYLVLALFSLIGAIWVRTTYQFATAILLGLSILFGSAFHFDVRYLQRGPYDVEHLADSVTRWHLYGQVDDWPTLKNNRTDCVVSIDSVSGGVGRPVHGKLLLRLSTETTALQRGDGIEFHSRIYPIKSSSLPEQFDYARYLNLKEVHGTVYLSTLIDVRVDRRNQYGIIHQIDRLRNIIRSSFYRNLDSTSAALAAGFMIGETHDIPEYIYTLFRDTGTLHLLAVSGSNVALVLLFMIWLLRPFSPGRGWRTLILLLTILVFSILSYGEPSVLRASVMATLVIIAGLVQRRYDLNNIVMLAGAIILIAVPSQLYDVGFQLSFVTAWGLIIATPYLHKKFKSYHTYRWYRWLMLPFLISLIAQFFSIPVIAFYFGVIPALSVPANLVIVPLVSLAVIGILLLLLADLLLPALGLLVGGWLNWLLQLVLSVLELFGGENTLLLSTGNPPLWIVFAAYGLILSLLFSIGYKSARRMVIWVCAISLQIVLITAVVTAIEATDDIELIATRVPGGYAVLLKEGISTEADMIVSGLSSKEYALDERIFVPLLNALDISKIRHLFVLSADYDAIDDVLNLAKSNRVDSIFVSGQLYNSFRQVSLEQSLPGDMSIIKLPPTLPDFGIDDRLYASSAGVVIRHQGINIALTPEITSKVIESLKGTDIGSIVVDRLTIREAELISTLDSTRTLPVICSYFAQGKSKDVSEGNSTILISGLRIIELSSTSPLVVRFSPSSGMPVQISGLQ